MDQNNQPAMAPTERVSAPATGKPEWILPRNKRTGSYGTSGSAMVNRYPDVRGGICEFCGVLDQNVESQYQYKLCPHYRGMSLACDYCGGKRDADEVAYHSTLLITDHPDDPNRLVVRCNAYPCIQAHEKRFKVGL